MKHDPAVVIMEKLHKKLVQCARKNTPVRYGVIALLAGYLFFVHLFRYKGQECRRLAMLALSAILVLSVILPVHAELMPPDASSSESGSVSGGNADGAVFDIGAAPEILPVETVTPEAADIIEEVISLEGRKADAGMEAAGMEGNAADTVSGGDTDETAGGDAGGTASGGDAGGTVSGGDAEGTVSGGDAEGTVSGGDADGTVSGGDNGDQSGGDGGTQPDGSTESTKPVFLPEISILSRNGGMVQNDIFFTSGGAWYEVAVKGWDSTLYTEGYGVSGINYSMGGELYSAQVLDGKAVIAIPDETDAQLKIYCSDPGGENPEVLSERVISEKTGPKISEEIKYEQDGTYYVYVTVEESGSVLSGISGFTCLLDGEEVEIAADALQYVYGNLTETVQIPVTVSFKLPLEQRPCTLEVTAGDNAGNRSEYFAELTPGPQDVITVVLPTSFQISMLQDRKVKGRKEGIVQSNDVIICNKSEFPIKVSVKGIQVDIAPKKDKNGVEKSCKLSCGLYQSGSDEKRIPLAEGSNDNPIEFNLAQGNASTDAAGLFRDAGKGDYQEHIASPDYAVLRLDGSMNAAGWQDGDLKVCFVFDFSKVEEN